MIREDKLTTGRGRMENGACADHFVSSLTKTRQPIQQGPIVYVLSTVITPTWSNSRNMTTYWLQFLKKSKDLQYGCLRVDLRFAIQNRNDVVGMTSLGG